MIIQNDTEFVIKLAENWDKAYTRTQSENIKRLIREREISDEQLDSLYDKLTRKCKHLPRVGEIEDYLNSNKTSTSEKLSEDIYSQTPNGIRNEFAGRPTDWIIETCRKIRVLYDADPRQVSSKRTSFLVVWEPLLKVKSHDRERMKQLIISGHKEAIEDFLDVAIEKVPFDSVIIDNKFKTKRTA